MRALLIAAIAIAACHHAPPPVPPVILSNRAAVEPPAPRSPDRMAIRRGRRLAYAAGCISCHSTDGSERHAPSFRGLSDRLAAGSIVFDDGTTLADALGPRGDFDTADAYLRAKILTPRVKWVRGYRQIQPAYEGSLDPWQLDDLIAFITSL